MKKAYSILAILCFASVVVAGFNIPVSGNKLSVTDHRIVMSGGGGEGTVVTNIIVTQINAVPNPAGTYIEGDLYNGHRSWYCSATAYSIWWDTPSGGYYMLGPFTWDWITMAGPTGTYEWDGCPENSGTASAAFQVVTNF